MAELKYWLWLSTLEGIPASTMRKLLESFHTPKDIFFAADEALDMMGFHSAQLREKLVKNFRRAEEVLSLCRKKNIRILTMGDAEYPERLLTLPDAPPVLYLCGRLPEIDEEAVIAIVGTRKCTEYGYRCAKRLAGELASGGAVVATGLAAGVDSAAAWGALEAGGRVIGVLGNGLDIVYPRENRDLYERVARSGVLISEFPPGSPPIKWHFPARNRIISGLSLGVTVVEAPLKSGARITAGTALEQGRDVFVMPGKVDDPACAGSNILLREGATPILCGEDILSEYRHRFGEKLDLREKTAQNPETESKKVDRKTEAEYTSLPEARADGDERTVLLTMTRPSMAADEIIEASGIGAPRVLAALTMLEMSGLVSRDERRRYTRNVSVK